MEKTIEQKAKDLLVYHNGKKDFVIMACNMAIDSTLVPEDQKEEARQIKEWIILNK